MVHNKDIYKEQIIEHLEQREWNEREINGLLRMIGSSALMSEQGALNILLYQQATDETIEASKQHDEVFIQDSLFEPTVYQDPLILEATDSYNQYFVERFNHMD